MNSAVSCLAEWYLRQCDGEWEHEFGIKIETIDNPGWRISIPLERTDCESKVFEGIEINRSENDWIHCKKIGEQFLAWGGTSNLSEMLRVFLSWSTSE